jgi:hypothetical protein
LCGYNHKIEKLEKNTKTQKLEITQVAPQKKRFHVVEESIM